MILDFAAMNEFQYPWLIVFWMEVILFFWLFWPLLDRLEINQNAEKRWGRYKITDLLLSVLWVIAYLAAKWKLEGYIFLNIIAMMALGVIYLRVFSSQSFRNLIWLAAVFTVCIELGRILVYGPIYITGNHEFYLHHTWMLRVVGQVLKTFFVWLCRKKVCEYSSKYQISLVNYLLIHLAIVQLIFMHYRRRVSAENLTNIRIETETFLILGGGVLAILAIMLYQIQTFLQEKSLETIQQAMNANYLEIQKNNEMDREIRRIYHDLKQQLAALDLSAESSAQEERQKMTDQLNRQITKLERVNGTGNTMLDSLLTHKLMEAHKRRIQLELFVETIDYSFVDTVDLCSIIGNAIDNAMEAVDHLQENEQRRVQVKAAVLQGIWVFKVENPCARIPEMVDGTYISTKPGPRREGIGIRSIQYCVNKYQGNVEIQTAEGHFILKVMMPAFA